MEPISSLSTVHVFSFVEGATGGETIEVAFTEPGTAPDTGDWHAGEWDNPTLTGCPARILVGPQLGALDLGPGTWDMWVRVSGLTEVPVFNAGQVPIT